VLSLLIEQNNSRAILAKHCQKETFGHSKARFITFVSERKELSKENEKKRHMLYTLIFTIIKRLIIPLFLLGQKDDGVNDFPPIIFTQAQSKT
jgi:hypothetical protein